jgi:cytosine/uracil/thiamine/allantoin permease
MQPTPPGTGFRPEDSPLWSPDLAPLGPDRKNWSVWNVAALWVGMAVCIPTYLLASFMIRNGLSWSESLWIIGMANLVITIPMVLNGHAGVAYGIPFPVAGRAAFGYRGIHLVALLRGFIACGWFGIQTWVGGLSLHSIACVFLDMPDTPGLSAGKFAGFAVFWLINLYFVWKGTESIRWLEDLSAPVLIGTGLILIGWAWSQTGSFSATLDAARAMQTPGAQYSLRNDGLEIKINPLRNRDGTPRTRHFIIEGQDIRLEGSTDADGTAFFPGIRVPAGWKVRLRDEKGNQSSALEPVPAGEKAGSRWSLYLLWFTAMVGFWATMSISISDITRFASNQKSQILGQFLGLPGTMLFYSFVGIFVTSGSLLAFPDILAPEDAPWDPVSLVGRFENPFLVVFAQFALLLATLSTNIAANIMAPAYALFNLMPRRLSFRSGGIIAGLLGVASCPWWLMNELSDLLVVVSGLLGPVLGVLLCDYFWIRKCRLDMPGLFNPDGRYRYTGGFHLPALLSVAAGVLVALLGKWVPRWEVLYTLSWFSGFFTAFFLYRILFRPAISSVPDSDFV